MTPNKEDYLKCIYEIGIDLHKITKQGNCGSYASLSPCRN